jgi:hypothetical protein
MKSNKYIPDPGSSDSDDANDSDMDEGIAAGQATEADVAQVEDATFPDGVAVPAAPCVTTYLHLKKHFGQQQILLVAFLKTFRNCSFISSDS